MQVCIIFVARSSSFDLKIFITNLILCKVCSILSGMKNYFKSKSKLGSSQEITELDQHLLGLALLMFLYYIFGKMLCSSCRNVCLVVCFRILLMLAKTHFKTQHRNIIIIIMAFILFSFVFRHFLVSDLLNLFFSEF